MTDLLLPISTNHPARLQGSSHISANLIRVRQRSALRRYCRVGLERTGAVVLYQPAELISLAVAEFGEAVAA